MRTLRPSTWEIEAFVCSSVISLCIHAVRLLPVHRRAPEAKDLIYQFIAELRKLLEAVDYMEAVDFVEIEAPPSLWTSFTPWMPSSSRSLLEDWEDAGFLVVRDVGHLPLLLRRLFLRHHHPGPSTS